MKKLFEGIYSDSKSIYTKNLNKGKKVYGEKIINKNNEEYREWNPYRSKYCAGIKNGLKKNIFFEGCTALYLGSAEGTTVSHISDIVEKNGAIFCVDLSEIAMHKLTKLAEERENIYPILSDAQRIENYKEFLEEKVDALFQDISQRNQAEIFCKNAAFLKKGSYGCLSLKTKSISQSKTKQDILIEEKKILEKEFMIEQILSIEPYEKEHYLILVKKK
ncbi:MAG: fibrillarin-like rRNA/tRNA 2'-O-methyltransferase [Candidatus Diapherotrites archaeon]|jgi:fibrillarin-like pre-rRNA processing protein|uniref:Fibrillarin-like rRNA/tRNA 2'-O-methyltransferase n=1 Tax=Candidatus Iainarchaeum sp. TaxID=3101447 RepID=A0A7K4BZ32_9ARCH|nr:fibrillarin-like rRNA/tRNA 2'-O-methyltransferase [Candidatus Diapherotrites archaeon]